MEYKRILIGTDGRELMGPVFDHSALAQLADSTVHAVYVLDAWGTKYPSTRGGPCTTPCSVMAKRLSLTLRKS